MHFELRRLYASNAFALKEQSAHSFLYFDKRTRVTEILRMFSNGVAVMTGMAWVLHQNRHFLLLAFFPQLANVQPMTFRIFTFGFHGF